MDKAQRISATEARNNFFTILNESYLKKKTFLVEKSDIPVVYIIPSTSPIFSDIRKKNRLKKNLRLLREIEELQKGMKDTGDSTVLLRQIRRHGR